MSVEGKLCKRIIPCLDVANGKTVKGVNFTNLRDIGDPVELGLQYEEQGADELTFLDISASNEERATVVDLVRRVADNLSIPFTVGGGIKVLDDVKRLLANGADKVSINTAAVKRAALVGEIARACGSQCCVVAIDVKRIADSGNTGSGNTGSGNTGSGKSDSDKTDIGKTDAGATSNGVASEWPGSCWEVLINGGRVSTGMDAYEWAIECVDRGAGEILLTSWDKDGTLSGFDIELMRRFAKLPVPVIASGGARDPESFVDVFINGHADAALAASIFHDGTFSIGDVKRRLAEEGVLVRIC